MNYSEAMQFIESKQTFLGKVYRGFMVNGFLIVPANKKLRRTFFKSYFNTRNALMSIQPYKNEDLIVWAVDFRKLSEGKIDYIEM